MVFGIWTNWPGQRKSTSDASIVRGQDCMGQAVIAAWNNSFALIMAYVKGYLIEKPSWL
jgi:hypothetical protein